MEMTSAAMRRPTFSFNEFPWGKGSAKAFLRQDFYAPLLHFSGLNRRTKLDETTGTSLTSYVYPLRFSLPLFRLFERIIIRIIN